VFAGGGQMIMAGPVSSASPDGSGGLEYFLWGGIACFVVWTWVRDWKRTKEIRQYAQSKGFVYIGAVLPRSFPFSETSVGGARSVANAVAGDRSGMELLFFDCKLDYGEYRKTQTVVAVRGPEECFGLVRFGPSLETEKAGEWALVFRSNERMPLEEIDALLAEV
jgi:hypothetical protein